MEFRTPETDVLIIGGGAAACRAAIEASDLGADVTIVDKGIFGQSGCSGMHWCWAIAGIGLGDSTNYFLKDIVKGGGFLSNQKLAAILAAEAPKRIIDLERYGNICIRKESGDVKLSQFGGHSIPRTLNGVVLWMLGMEAVRRGVRVFQETMAVKLLTYNRAVTGAICINIRTGDLYILRSKSTILATGGAGQIYGWGTVSAITDNPIQITGDGIAMAYRTGAELVDMEQIQYTPVAVTYPPQFKGSMPAGEAAIKEAIFNKDLVPFLEKIPLATFTRAQMAKAVINEIREGRGTPHGGVWLNLKVLVDKQKANPISQSTTVDICRIEGFDIQKDLIEVYPRVHHFMGGVAINEMCETSIPGLYACGEVTGGIHGANRLGSVAFADTQVFGKRAGQYAAEHALAIGKPKIEWRQVEEENKRVFNLLEKKPVNGLRPYKIRRKLQTTMWENVGIFRNERDLRVALKEIERIKEEDLPRIYVASKSRTYNYDWVEALETYYMIDVAEMVARSALMRTESREAHQREDYPQTNDEDWLANVYINLVDEKMELEKRPIITTAISVERNRQGEI